MADGVRGRDKCNARQDHFISGLHALKQQRRMKRRGAVNDGNSVRAPVAAATICSNWVTYLPADDTQLVSMQSRTSSRSRAPGAVHAAPLDGRRSQEQYRLHLALLVHRARRRGWKRRKNWSSGSQIVDVGAIAGKIWLLLNQDIVCSSLLRSPSTPPKRGDQPSSFSPWRCWPTTVDFAAFRPKPSGVLFDFDLGAHISAIIRATSPIEISNPLPILMTSPIPAFVSQRGNKATDSVGNKIEIAGRVACFQA